MVKMNLLALTNKWDNNFCICPDSNQGSNVDDPGHGTKFLDCS